MTNRIYIGMRPPRVKSKERAPFSEKTKRIMSETKKRIWQDPKVRERYIKGGLRRWQDLEFQRMMAIARYMKPNKLEQFFDAMTPECIKYVGDFKLPIKTKIGTRFPDFVIKEQNKIIELFGDFYHKGENPKNKIREYKEVGFDCIIFWEHEVYNDTERVLKETLKFMKLEEMG